MELKPHKEFKFDSYVRMGVISSKGDIFAAIIDSFIKIINISSGKELKSI